MLKIERTKWRDMITPPKKRIGLALGGGGARGLAHIGVLKILELAGVQIDLIVGTSIGALIGAMYAINPDADALYRKCADFLHSPVYKQTNLDRLGRRKNNDSFFAQVASSVKERVVINLAQNRLSLASDKKVIRTLEFLLKHQPISETRIPFAAVSTDLNSGNEIVFTDGDIIRAIAASSAIPGFLPPVKFDDKLLVDGFILNPVPVIPARKLGVDIVIGVDVGQSLDNRIEVENIIDVIFRSNLITARKYNSMLLNQADIILKPTVGRFHWAEFKHLETIVRQGEKAAEAHIFDIFNAIQPKRYFFRNLISKKTKSAASAL